MLKLAGVKTEAAFYKKYPTQEAFMKVHGKAFKKAQIGTYIGGQTAAAPKPINFNDAYDQSDLSITGKTNKMRQEEADKQATLAAQQKPAGGDMLSQIGGALGNLGEAFAAEHGAYIPKAQIGRNLQPIGQNLQPAGMVNVGPQIGQPQAFSTGALPNQVNPAQSATMGKIGEAIGKYAGPVGDVIQGISALKAEKKAVKQAEQTKQLSGLALDASKTRPEQTQRKYVRPEDMITSGNQLGAAQGTGTNILAEDGAFVKGKPKKGKKVDVRKETDVIRIPSNVNAGETNYVRTTKSLKGLGKRDNKLQQDATNDFVDWYSDPETKKRFAKNTGMDPARLQDFVGKALRTPMQEYDSAKVNDYPLDGNAEAVFRSPYYNESVGDKSHPKTGYIMHRPQAGDIPELNSYATNMSSAIQHELAHASGLDNVLGNALFRAMGKKPVTKDQKGNLNYMDRPEELYGHFHEFRTSLGLKPGQKVTREELKKKVEGNKRVNSTSRFWQYESNDDKTGEQSDAAIDKIVNAINTVAYNPNNNDNATYAEDGAEIQNTYAPDTLYDDLGYEPLEDYSQVKQYQNGGFPWDAAGDFGANVGGAIVGQDAGAGIGGTIGGTIGSAFGPMGKAIGKTLGTVAGGLIDTNDNKIKKAKAATERNMTAMSFGNSAQGLQAQNASYMEYGGYVSNDWTPQVIAKFGEYDVEDLFAPDKTMDTLRAGGHLKEYRDPSERAMQTFAMGGDVSNSNLGEVEVESGGYLEPISYNPYNDGTGVTSMIKGQSHDEYNSKLGHSGVILNAYGNQVEAERGEPIREMEEGGSLGNDKSAVITGNLVYKNINNIMDPKYKKYEGKKIKNIHKEIALKDQKLNKLEEKNTNKLVEIDPKTSIDKLQFAALQANDLGYKMQYKNNAKDADYFTNHQTIINNTAEELGIDADSLAKGKVKTAKMGGQFTKAQYGAGLDKYRTNFVSEPNLNSSAINLDEVKIPVKKIDYMRKALSSLSPKGIVEPNMTPQGSPVPESAGRPMNIYEASDETKSRVPRDYSWIEAVNSVIPALRPSDAEDLNGNQLLGEMYALSQNQEEPVQAQQYSPELINSYKISLQDKKNEVIAQTRAAQRMAQGNPSAQAMINAQAYEALDKIGGEEFRINQEIADKVIAGNIATMNDAKLKNLGILDQQYARQAQAKSNTKAVTQAALNSISDKYAKNSLENRTLKTYENMYNYRYDAAGRAINMNQMPQFNIPTVGTTSKPKDASGDDLLPVYDKSGDIVKYMVKQDAKTKTKSKNGSIVKAMRNL